VVYYESAINDKTGGISLSTLLKREQITEMNKWKLEDMYATEELWEQDIIRVKELIENFSIYKGKIATDFQLLAACLKLDQEISVLVEKAYVFAKMRQDENNKQTHYQEMVQRAESLSVEYSSASAFILPELLLIADGAWEKAFIEHRELAFFEPMITKIIRQKKHTLETRQEEILAALGEVTQTASNVFNMIDNADLIFNKVKNADGDEIQLTHGNYSEMLESKDRILRKNAFQANGDAYNALKNTLGTTYLSHVKKNAAIAKLRHYNSSLDAALFYNNIPTSVYNNLITTTKTFLPGMQRYYDIRREMLELDELHVYDLYVPIIANSTAKITYEESYHRMKLALSPLGKDYARVLDIAYKDGWIDVYENEGKTSGAYSWGSYGTHPYVLLNHKDNLDSMFTLAHEMGHALHSYYSDKNLPYTYAQYTIFVAEVASTVNELLLMRYLLNRTDDKKEKIFLIDEFIQKFRGTLFRQVLFAEFEKIVHENIESGEQLSHDSLSDIYFDLNQEHFGSSVVLDESNRSAWSSIPHFYNSFYVFQYATGISAAASISKQILEEGQPAVERYLTFLKSGGSDFPIELLKIAGVDMSSSKPVSDALELFSSLVDELDALRKE
jgi:oligoendopeptidase F